MLTEGAQNWPFLMLIIFPVLAAATSRSVCHDNREIVIVMTFQLQKGVDSDTFSTPKSYGLVGRYFKFFLF